MNIVTGSNTRDSVAMEKPFVKLIFEGLCGATVTLVERLDYSTPHSWYTLASQLRSGQGDIAECFALLLVVYHDGTFKAAPLEF